MKYENYGQGLRDRAIPFIDKFVAQYPTKVSREHLEEISMLVMENIISLEMLQHRLRCLATEEVKLPELMKLLTATSPDEKDLRISRLVQMEAQQDEVNRRLNNAKGISQLITKHNGKEKARLLFSLVN